ncbi:MAG TPA: hypothetical protein VGE07_21990 [Herpetosiphonaceae bacterium]
MSREPDAPVLVAIVAGAADWRRVAEEGWYRIPLRRAPRRMDADLLALYQTKRCGAGAGGVRWYAPILRSAILRRAELLPDEPGHPRADERYWRLELGPLSALPRPIPAGRARRTIFIPTTWGALLTAGELADLWPAGRDAGADSLRETFGVDRRRLREARRRYGRQRPAILLWIAARPGEGPAADPANGG